MQEVLGEVKINIYIRFVKSYKCKKIYHNKLKNLYLIMYDASV